MSNFRLMDREAGLPMPPSVDEWFSERHLARFVQAPNDKRQLEPMLGKITALPEEFGKTIVLLADSGCFSEDKLNACAAAGVDPVIAMRRKTHHILLDARLLVKTKGWSTIAASACSDRAPDER